MVTKQQLKEIGERRVHDRLGVILFADAAYVQPACTDGVATWQAYDVIDKPELQECNPIDMAKEFRLNQALGNGRAVNDNQSLSLRLLICRKAWASLSLPVPLSPITNVVVSCNAMQDVWLGYSIHHRSAIFESASRFGWIKGGSNYNTIYLQFDFHEGCYHPGKSMA